MDEAKVLSEDEWVQFFKKEVRFSYTDAKRIAAIFYRDKIRKECVVYLKEPDLESMGVTVKGDRILILVWIDKKIKSEAKIKEEKFDELLEEFKSISFTNSERIAEHIAAKFSTFEERFNILEEIMRRNRLNKNLVKIRTPLDEISKYKRREGEDEKAKLMKDIALPMQKLKEAFPNLHQTKIDDAVTESKKIASEYYGKNKKSPNKKSPQCSTSTKSSLVKLTKSDYIDHHFENLKLAGNIVTHEDNQSVTNSDKISRSLQEYNEICEDIEFLESKSDETENPSSSNKRKSFGEENPHLPSAKQMRVMEPVFPLTSREPSNEK